VKKLSYISLLILAMLFLFTCQPQFNITFNITPEGAGKVSYKQTNENVNFGAIPNNGYVFDHWEGDFTGTTNPVSLSTTSNKTITAVFGATISDDFETNNGTFSTKYEWRLGGNANPFIQGTDIYGGQWASQFGNISDNQKSYFETTINYTNTITISFCYKVSSEDRYDFLRFYIDGEEQMKADGITDWRTYTSPQIPAGEHILQWAYTKDVSQDEGLDTAWVDNIGAADGTPFILKANWKAPTENATLHIVKTSTREKEKGYKYTNPNGYGKNFDSITVKFREGVKVVSKDNIVNAKYSKYGSVKYNPINPKFNIAVITPPDSSIANWKEILDYYNSLPEVEYAEPNHYLYAFDVEPNDPRYSEQWDMQQLMMPAVWDITMGNSNVVVAVIDTGVAVGLSDSPINIDTVNDHDFINNDDNAHDDHYHGTHVAGTIAQATNNSIGVVGMAPDVTILPIKVLSASGYGTDQQVADGIVWAADHGAHIINMSLGDHEGDVASHQVLYDACQYAYGMGVTIFAATGNDYDDYVSYPAAFDNVIAVGATNSSKEKAGFSNYGDDIDIVAPGTDILQQTSSGMFELLDGTSMACPHAVGLGALLKSVDFNLSPDDIFDAITFTVEDLGETGWDIYFGYGLINPIAALGFAQGISYSVSNSLYSSISGNIVRLCGMFLQWKVI